VAWPLSKYLLTMLPLFFMRAASTVLGCALAFAAATAQGERIRRRGASGAASCCSPCSTTACSSC
jgi:hypothetical protein